MAEAGHEEIGGVAVVSRMNDTANRDLIEQHVENGALLHGSKNLFDTVGVFGPPGGLSWSETNLMDHELTLATRYPEVAVFFALVKGEDPSTWASSTCRHRDDQGRLALSFGLGPVAKRGIQDPANTGYVYAVAPDTYEPWFKEAEYASAVPVRPIAAIRVTADTWRGVPFRELTDPASNHEPFGKGLGRVADGEDGPLIAAPCVGGGHLILDIPPWRPADRYDPENYPPLEVARDSTSLVAAHGSMLPKWLVKRGGPRGRGPASRGR